MTVEEVIKCLQEYTDNTPVYFCEDGTAFDNTPCGIVNESHVDGVDYKEDALGTVRLMRHKYSKRKNTVSKGELINILREYDNGAPVYFYREWSVLVKDGILYSKGKKRSIDKVGYSYHTTPIIYLMPSWLNKQKQQAEEAQ